MNAPKPKLVPDWFFRALSTAREPGPLARWKEEGRPVEVRVGGCGWSTDLSTRERRFYVYLHVGARDREFRIELPVDQAADIAKELIRLAEGLGRRESSVL